MVDIINLGHAEVFTADCLPSMKKKKDRVCLIWFPLTPRVVSANNQEKEKEHRIEQVWTYKFYKIKARGKYKTVPDFFYIVKNHFTFIFLGYS